MLSGSGAVGDGGLETWQKDFGPKSSVPESLTFFPALGATPPGCHTRYMPHPLRIEVSNIYSHVKSQVSTMKND